MRLRSADCRKHSKFFRAKMQVQGRVTKHLEDLLFLMLNVHCMAVAL